MPVERDLSDLAQKIEWGLAHDDEARAIAARGQAFALAHALELGREIAIDAIRRAAIPPAGPENRSGRVQPLGAVGAA